MWGLGGWLGGLHLGSSAKAAGAGAAGKGTSPQCGSAAPRRAKKAAGAANGCSGGDKGGDKGGVQLQRSNSMAAGAAHVTHFVRSNSIKGVTHYTLNPGLRSSPSRRKMALHSGVSTMDPLARWNINWSQVRNLLLS